MAKLRICPDCGKPQPTAFGRFVTHNISSFPYERRCWGSNEISSGCRKALPLAAQMKDEVRTVTEKVVGKRGVTTPSRPFGMAAMAAHLAALCVADNLPLFSLDEFKGRKPWHR